MLSIVNEIRCNKKLIKSYFNCAATQLVRMQLEISDVLSDVVFVQELSLVFHHLGR